MTKAIELNDSIRGFAASSPIAMLCVVGMYTTTGKVNSLDLCELERAVAASVRIATSEEILDPKDFDTEQAYNDQFNHRIIMEALATALSGKFQCSTIPGMVKEMYVRIKSNSSTRDAYRELSETSRAMEKAVMDKAVAELY